MNYKLNFKMKTVTKSDWADNVRYFSDLVIWFTSTVKHQYMYHRK